MMESNAKVPEIYAGMVFNDKVMRERLPKDVYKAVRKTSKNGTHLPGTGCGKYSCRSNEGMGN